MPAWQPLSWHCSWSALRCLQVSACVCLMGGWVGWGCNNDSLEVERAATSGLLVSNAQEDDASDVAAGGARRGRHQL